MLQATCKAKMCVGYSRCCWCAVACLPEKQGSPITKQQVPLLLTSIADVDKGCRTATTSVFSVHPDAAAIRTKVLSQQAFRTYSPIIR